MSCLVLVFANFSQIVIGSNQSAANSKDRESFSAAFAFLPLAFSSKSDAVIFGNTHLVVTLRVDSIMVYELLINPLRQGKLEFPVNLNKIRDA
jgi:hypothetical protein